MKLYYAPGGGLGHLSRAKAFISTLHFEVGDFILLTNSGFVDIVFENANIIAIPDEYYHQPDKLIDLIHSVINQYNINEFYVDSFPNGIIGELGMLKESACSFFYIARSLSWGNYLPLIGPEHLTFDKTFVVEKLDLEQSNFIKQNSSDTQEIELMYSTGRNPELRRAILSTFRNPPWLIVHSEPFEELQLLVDYARDTAEIEKMNPEYLVISQAKQKLSGENIRQINYYPASDFFPFSDKIFTACGFNSMYQTIHFADKHHFIPFVRRFDDQFARARARKLNL